MPARILIIEDDPPSAELAQYLLEAAGHATLLATRGQSGLEMAIAERPDLILCDMQIPEIDGYTVAQRLHTDRRWRHVPLVAVTALSMHGDRERCIAAGFDGYITKPITPETFVGEIEVFLPPAQRCSGSA